MDLYKVQIPLDSYDIVTGSTVVSGQTIPTGYVNLTKTADTYVNLFLTSDYDDIGLYTDFNDRDIFEMITEIPILISGTTKYQLVPTCVNCSDTYNESSDLPVDTLYIHPDGRVLYNSSLPIVRFEFGIEWCNCSYSEIQGVINSHYGGDAGIHSFEYEGQTNNSGYAIIVGQVPPGSGGLSGMIPAGHGVLLNLNISQAGGGNCLPKKAVDITFWTANAQQWSSIPINYLTDVVTCDPCCIPDPNPQYVEIEAEEDQPCSGEILTVTMTGGEFDVLTIDIDGPYETILYSGGTVCLPFGCYGYTFLPSRTLSSFSIEESNGNILAEYQNPIDEGTATDILLSSVSGEFCLECKPGKLQIATHQSFGYSGATAYVVPVTICDEWWVTGMTSNNMMEILPIAGISQLTADMPGLPGSHIKYDSNENPIEVTFAYGVPPTGATYNIGEAEVKIHYDTTNINNRETAFTFKRECCEECYGLNTKEEMKMGWVFDPKINVNVFIDRGQNSVFDKLLRLSEVSNNEELLDYNNNFFKVNKQQL